MCMFPTNNECLTGISDAFSAFCLRVFVIFPTCSLYPQQKHAYSALHPQAWTCIYTAHACRHLPSAVPWISEDRLLTLRLSCTSRFGITVQGHCPNLISNGSFIRIAVTVETAQSIVTTCPFQEQHATSKSMNFIRQPVTTRRMDRRGGRSEVTRDDNSRVMARLKLL